MVSVAACVRPVSLPPQLADLTRREHDALVTLRAANRMRRSQMRWAWRPRPLTRQSVNDLVAEAAVRAGASAHAAPLLRILVWQRRLPPTIDPRLPATAIKSTA